MRIHGSDTSMPCSVSRFLLEEMGLIHMIKKPTSVCGDNGPATRLLWNDIVAEGNQFFGEDISKNITLERSAMKRVLSVF